MYSGQQFDGAAAFAGGGFMPSQATAPPPPSFASSKNRNIRTLTPLTVKQIKDVSSNDESGISSDGVDSNTITILGLVCDIQDKEPQFVFLIDDGTAKIECTRWAHERMEFNEVSQIARGMYVRVYGHLKSFQDKKTLNAYSIRPVIDFNEITSHFIECIYVHYHNTKLQESACTQPQMANSTVNTALKDYQVTSAYQSFDGTMSIEQKVLNLLQRPELLAMNNGVHHLEIARQLNLPVDKLMQVLESLCENSLVYTVDEVHFKSAVNA